MSIQRKFLFLIFGTILSFVLAVGSYFIIISPVKNFEKEEGILLSLANAFRDLKADMARIDNNAFRSQFEEIDQSEEKLRRIFLEVESMKFLPAASSEIEKSIQVINNLKNLLYSNWDEYSKLIPQIVEFADKVLMTSDTVLSESVIKNIDMSRMKDDVTVDIDAAVIIWMRIISQAGIIDDNLSSSIAVLDEQFENIDREIRAIEQRSLYISLGIIILIMLIVFFVFILFTNQISRNIKKIEEGIASISQGDLFTEIHVKSRDELASLSLNLNKFIGKLNSGIRDIKSSAGRNREIKDTLSEEVAETIGQVEQINLKTDNILRVLENLKVSINDSSAGVEVLESNVEGMTREIESQLAMVEESSSSVHQMIASISNVADITEKKGTATENLVATARRGGVQLENTTRIILEIHNSVDEISGTAAVIQAVASQTNLLAMNAAIEAAHAGDAGRGFAVVADEIRKLAETSSNNSKRISGVIKEVIANIEEAVASGTETKNAFSAIDQEVQGVSHSLNEISGSMSELNTGGEQILKAMDELQNVSTAVTGSSREMEEVSARFNSQIKRIEEIALDVNTGTREIEGSIREISSSMGKVGTLADDLDEVSETLTDEVDQYRISADEAVTRVSDSNLTVRSLEKEAETPPISEALEFLPLEKQEVKAKDKGFESSEDDEELLFEEYRGDSE